MTRFKELKRIRTAIEHNNKAELEWAARYCKMRVRLAQRKDHEEYWRKLDIFVRETMEKLT